ncbi:MAG: isopentenyl phosphate kinase family protein [Candidatus Aenigmatarchaeota archaeon]|nr:MAG: isopentenyl phosphate kinase family protein [Candidatus Aenigmarchaeota archaeon]
MVAALGRLGVVWMKGLYVLKLGGSLVTDKSSAEPKLAPDALLKRLSAEIRDFCADGASLIVVHGAGSYGHPLAKSSGIHEGIRTKDQLVAFAETQKQVNELAVNVAGYLIRAGVPAMPVQASASAVMNSGKLEKMDVDVIRDLLDIGMVPLLYGVPAYDRTNGCSILSGDEIAPYLARALQAKLIVHASDTDGIFTADPRKDKSATLIELVTRDNLGEVRKSLSGSSHVDVSGGAERKVMELFNFGVESCIVNGFTEGNILRALRGERVGTRIVP